MATNIYLFTGEETYLLHQELKRRTDGFVQKFGKDSLFTFSAGDFDAQSLMQAILGGGLFVSKKMVIVQGVPASTTDRAAAITEFGEQFTSRADRIGPDTLVVFVSATPDKRTKFYKYLQTHAQIKEFPKLKEVGVKSFIKEQLQGFDVSGEVLDHMIQTIGTSLYHIAHECDKLRTWAQSQNTTTITIPMVTQVSVALSEVNTFALFDNVFTNFTKVNTIIDEVHHEGTKRPMFIGALYYAFKNYILVVENYQSGNHDSKVLASQLGIHPFALKKIIDNIKTLQQHLPQIKKTFKQIVELDYNIKTGKLPEAVFRLYVKKAIYGLSIDQGKK